MRIATAGLQYLVAGLLGLVMAVLPTALVSWAVFPPDGPLGEGFIIIAILLVFCCACVPGYVALMALHRKGRRDTRRLVACEIGLRLSMVVAGAFLCFMAIKLPTRPVTKWFFCLLAVSALAWAINPKSWGRSQRVEHTVES